jgi:hypothetical protein
MAIEAQFGKKRRVLTAIEARSVKGVAFPRNH